MNSYTKLKSGQWGVRTEGVPNEGMTVIVTKKDGSERTETIERVIWTGADRETGTEIALCSIAKPARIVVCRHCGTENETTGHMTCQYPQDQ